MKNKHQALTQLAIDLTNSVSSQDRFDRLLSVIRHLFNCDASALLAFQDQQFSPLAINGLYDEVLGRRFNIQQHPRLEAIARAGDVVRFPADSELPDPYDGLIVNHKGELNVHSCIGLPLLANDHLIGALTIDAFDTHKFEKFSNEDLRIISALAAASLHTSLLLEKLENQTGMFNRVDMLDTYEPLPTQMIGQSVGIVDLQSQIKAVADTELSVLITGETGVGKELVASSLHAQSSRCKNNLIYLNCAALPESVAESELFGHVKGAFTGAISDRKGKFELANDSTLFLDEVGELPLSLQAKLLRALQYGDIQRVGDEQSLKVNTRIVAATNRALHEEVKAGRFRADLYHRLNVFPVHVPPLRERGHDVVLLSGFFAERCREKLGFSHLSIDPDAIKLLTSYTWPGNVRELEHAINRAAVIAKSQSSAHIDAKNKVAHLHLKPPHFQLSEDHLLTESVATIDLALQEIPTVAISLRQATDDFQAKLIERTYNDSKNNWSVTAKKLNLDTGNLHRLAKRLHLK
ncbi:anaerobic nitric oxide reductase transcription regulator NorR [Psychromonas marina]|uniref:Anaerobic nitric oxide reductase transcription regulator NorR n=1 Tax=Psychromonas marina TaxID=88364 RepID=A0ABQ6E1V2_9GAMM|nr:nitric oxide reductase transcriptional regulator NorR [Psychromonas marina]GLS91300.1 anaerobic nitric oxide reductase transcription regulator NorR [Psychromonas marina]